MSLNLSIFKCKLNLKFHMKIKNRILFSKQPKRSEFFLFLNLKYLPLDTETQCFMVLVFKANWGVSH